MYPSKRVIMIYYHYKLSLLLLRITNRHINREGGYSCVKAKLNTLVNIKKTP